MYKNEGNNEYRKKEFKNAVDFYTEGIKVNCKDDELNSKLYNNRATAYFNLGQLLVCRELAAPFNNMRTLKFRIVTNRYAFHCRQSL